MKKYKLIIIIVLLLTILIMSAVYSTFVEQLKIDGVAKIMGEWDVKISDIEIQEVSKNCDPGTPQYTDTSATFDAKLSKPGDKIIYLITIENDGTLDATLNDVVFFENGSHAISYSTTEIKQILKSGEKTTFSLTIKYNPEYEDILEEKNSIIIGVIEYVQSE